MAQPGKGGLTIMIQKDASIRFKRQGTFISHPYWNIKIQQEPTSIQKEQEYTIESTFSLPRSTIHGT